MKRPLADRIRAWLIAAFVGVTVVAAVGFVGLRLLLDEADGFRDTVEREAERQLGLPLDIGELSARIGARGPTLTLLDVAGGGGEGGRPRFVADRVELVIDPWGSLAAGALRIGAVAAEGARLRVDAGGLTDLVGGGRASESLPRLGAVPALEVAGARVTITGLEGYPELVLADFALTVRRSGGVAHGRLRFRPPERFGGTVAFAFTGKPAAPAGVAGQLDITLDDAAIGEAVRLLPGARHRLPAALRADGEMALTLRAGGVWAAQAELALGLPDPATRTRLQTLSGRLRWERFDSGWKLSGTNWSERGAPEQGDRGPMHFDLAREGQTWRGSVASARLEWLRALTPSFAAQAPSIAAVFERHQPAGFVERLQFTRQASAWTLQGRVAGLSWEASQRRPGLTGVAVSFSADEAAGQANIRVSEGMVAAPALFRAPLPVATADVPITWRLARDGAIDIATRGASVRNADLQARLDARLRVPPGAAPRVTLDATLERGHAGAVSRYLPVGIMKPKLVTWLDQAILAGELVTADVHLEGPLDRRLIDDPANRFDIAARVRDVRFSYAPGWEPLEAVAGTVRFSGPAMSIRATEARYRSVVLDGATAEIPDLRDARLAIEGAFRGQGEDMVRALRTSPLNRRADSLLDRLRVGGEHRLSLAITVPFHHRPIEVSGRVALDDATLSLARLPYKVTGVNGDIRFDRVGLRWERLTGTFAGAPIVSRAQVVSGDDGKPRIEVVARFSAAADDLLPGTRLTRLVDGTSDWLLTVGAPGFRDGNGRVALNFSSDLRGAAVSLPGAFGKAAETARRLTAELRFRGRDLAPVSVRYGDNLRAVADVTTSNGAGLGRLGVALGGGVATLPPSRAIRLTGRVTDLALASLIDGLSPVAAEAGAEARWPRNLEFDLALIRPTIDAYTLAEVRLKGHARAGSWDLALSGSAEGTLRRAGEATPVRLDLGALVLSTDATDDVSTAPRPSVPRITDTTGPPLAISVARLVLDGQSLGRFTLDNRRVPAGGRDIHALLDGPVLRFEATGTWRRGVGAAYEATLDTVDAGAALKALGFAPSLRDASGSASARLRWQGGPYRPDLPSLAGSLEFRFRDGAIPAVDPGAGRLVGLLSLSLVPRRLLLDFRDVTREGLAFDDLRARFDIENGVARPEIFYVDGPAVRITVKGPVDLVGQRYDQVVRVEPKVSSTLPLLGGLAAGPQVAAVLLLAQTLFQGGLNDASAIEYRIVGPWRAPEFKPLGRAETRPEAGTPGSELR